MVTAAASAEDVVILDRPQSAADRRNDYAYLLLGEILQRTRKEFGPYRLEQAPAYMERDRLLQEMKAGRIVNVAPQPSQPSWEANLISIPVPIDMGLQSWRLALITKPDQERLAGVRTTEELKNLHVGVGNGWASYGILRANGFTITPGPNYDGLFSMLMARRFDFFLRGVNEIWQEYDARKAQHPDLAVEQSFLVHMPLPWLFFTSPETPRLAKRISKGLESMVEDGSLRRFVLTHHEQLIRRSNICERRIFKATNPFMTLPALQRKELWLDLLDPKTGFCKNRPKPIS